MSDDIIHLKNCFQVSQFFDSMLDIVTICGFAYIIYRKFNSARLLENITYYSAMIFRQEQRYILI